MSPLRDVRTLVGVAWVLLALVPCSFGDPFTQLFQPPCDPVFDPTQGLMRWSNPVLWANLGYSIPGSSSGGIVQAVSNYIPGVDSGVGANVTIPCGTGVLLDVPRVTLHTLDIYGLLMVEDPMDVRRVYSVNASFIVVRGNLVAGTVSRHFSSSLTFRLLPNPNNRTTLTVQGPVLPNKTATATEPGAAGIGHKAFAVVGGAVSLRGMPGGPTSPSWVKLSATVRVGARSLTVDQDVSSLWPIGGLIVVAPTDIDPNQAETAVITGFAPSPLGGTTILVDRAFLWVHWGDPLPDGFGGSVDERGEVALLSRNIVITGADEGEPYRLEGGHFLVFQTNSGQTIEGVEFLGLGQQGNLGRYSLHFHVCGDTRGASTVRKNTIRNSRQRCVVAHASHNLTLESNVAYNTSGHCFMLEEGGEQDNVFLANLGILTSPVERLILKIINGSLGSDETDREPSTFWVTNLKNDFIDNVAAGSLGAGMWIELRGRVRGFSLNIPELAGINTLSPRGDLGLNQGNTFHSNTVMGLRTYPHGIRPVADTLNENATDPNADSAEEQAVDGLINGYNITGLNVYKHRNIGVFFQATGGVGVLGGTFADNQMGILQQSNSRGVIRDCRFIGATANTGTPPTLSTCTFRLNYQYCAPIRGCTFPPTNLSNAKMTLGWDWRTPLVGIALVGLNSLDVRSNNGRIVNTKFSGYDATCRPAGGISPAWPMGFDYWDAAVGFQGLEVAPGTPPVWFPTPTIAAVGTWKASPPSQTDLMLQDKDGSIVGGKGGYIIANNSFLLPPPSKPPCTPISGGNALACPGLCYRSLWIFYNEDAFNPGPWNSDPTKILFSPSQLSTLTLVREEDGATRGLEGPRLYSVGTQGLNLRRAYWVNLLANQTYSLIINPPARNLSFWPADLFLMYTDGWDGEKPCRGWINFRPLPQNDTAGQWAVVNSDDIWWKPCPNVSVTRWPISYQASCFNDKVTLLLTLEMQLGWRIPARLVSTTSPVQACTFPALPCGILPSGDTYTFNTSGLEQRLVAPPALGYHTVAFNDSSWPQGSAVIGFVSYIGLWTTTRTVPSGTVNKVRRTTFYFRKIFSVGNPACFTALVLEYLPVSGALVFLNGAEILRYNLPQGTVNASTYALVQSTFSKVAIYSSVSVPLGAGSAASLNQGLNVLAYETHVFSANTYTNYFDSRAFLLNQC